MNAGPSSDRQGGEYHPGNDLDPRHEAVERLLGRAPMPEPDAWFTARTLARCREVRLAAEARAFASFSEVWRWVLGGGLGVCLAVLLMVPQTHPAHSVPADKQKNVQEAFAIMASFDSSDSDSSSSSSWQDSSY